jgi:hypothetical protein
MSNVKLSDKAIAMVENTIRHTQKLEQEGVVPFMSSAFWEDFLKDPSQSKSLVKEVELLASGEINEN